MTTVQDLSAGMQGDSKFDIYVAYQRILKNEEVCPGINCSPLFNVKKILSPQDLNTTGRDPRPD